jgi:hypothetical protein
MGLVAFGLATAGAVAVGLFVGVGHSGLRLEAAETSAPANPAGQAGDVRVDAPGTAVNVDKEHGKVSVTAPYTDVQVDPDKGRVLVRAPHVNLDVRW